MRDCGSLKRAQKGRETCPFRAPNGFNEIRLSDLERMAGTTRLELATSAVTGFISTYNDLQEHGRHPTVSHCKTVLDIAIVYLVCTTARIESLLWLPLSLSGKALRSNLRYSVSDARISASRGVCGHFGATF